MSASAFPTGILSSDPQISALLLEPQTERDKRAALEVEVGVLKKRLEAVSQVESAADYQYMLYQLHVRTVELARSTMHYHDF